MKRFHAFHHCIVGVDRHGTTVLVAGPSQLYRVMGGPYLEESDQREGFDPMRGRPGLYRATLDCRWQPGSWARVLAGQDPVVELTAREVAAEGVERWAIERCEVVLGYAPAREGLTARLARALHRLQTRVLHAC